MTMLVPVQDPHGAKRVPAAGFALANVDLEEDLAGMSILGAPATFGVALGSDDFDSLRDSLLRRHAGVPQVLQPAQDVVEVPGWERELEPAGVDHLAGRLPT